MTTKHGILTLTLALALTGCATDSTGWHVNQDSDTTGHIPLPDNPQVPANDKIRALGSISDADNAFIRDAEGGNIFEISAGRKALFKSSDLQVKNLAQHLVDDHSKSDKELLALASRKGLSAAASMNPSQISLLARLDSLEGSDFDREFLTQQETAHQDTINKYEAASQHADDKDVRDFATLTIPTLRNHLTMVQKQSQATLNTPHTNPNPDDTTPVVPDMSPNPRSPDTGMSQ